MKAYNTWLLACLICTIVIVQTDLCFSQETKIPRFVLGPPGKTELTAYKQMIDHPEQWEKLRPYVGALLVTTNWIRRSYPDDNDLKAAMQKLRQLNMPIEIEVGALKEWGKTGEGTYRAQTQEWDRILQSGGNVISFAMDEPFIASREYMKISRENNGDMEFAAEETAVFIELVRKNYPGILIGDIEAFPYFSADELIQWIDLLQSKLKARGLSGLDFFRVDTNWPNFVVGNTDETWQDLKKIENHCRSINLPISVIYWAADYGNPRFEGYYDDRTWYVGIMRMAYDYNIWNGGNPDQLCIESWVGGPVKTLPESDPFSFTGSALDFAERFLKKSGDE